jgi:hypothetical protein
LIMVRPEQPPSDSGRQPGDSQAQVFLSVHAPARAFCQELVDRCLRARDRTGAPPAGSATDELLEAAAKAELPAELGALAAVRGQQIARTPVE